MTTQFHHIAVCSSDISKSVVWYCEQFSCQVEYQDETWAMLKFGQIRLALVKPDQHPAHIAIEAPDHPLVAGQGSRWVKHRDGTESAYVFDPDNNAIEILKPL